jgi:hypothetical protein
MRWWSGTGWTEHVSAPVQAAPPQAPQHTPVEARPLVQPAPVQTRAYVPFQNVPFQNANLAEEPWIQGPTTNNRPAWLSLLFGLLAVLMIVLGNRIPFGSLVLIPAAALAVVFGIRALVLRRSGRTSIRWPAIIGIVLGGLTTLLMLIGLLAAAIFLGAVVAHSSQSGSPVQSSGNTELMQMTASARLIEQEIRSHTPGNDWPTTLAADASGRIEYQGAFLGGVESGETFAYQTTESGRSYQFEIIGRTPGDRVLFTSATKTLVATCNTAEPTCSAAVTTITEP